MSVSTPADGPILPIFVVGFPRSGTTLVQSLFAAHEKVLALPESHLLTSATAKLGPLRKLGLARRPRAGLPRIPFGLCSQKSLLQEFARNTDAAAHRERCVAWAEKTPAHLQFVAQIESVLPDARFVHVVRNPVPAIASLHLATQEFPQSWGGPRTVEACLRRWKQDLGRSARCAGRTNHTMIRYETLVANPDSTADRLFARVGVPLERGEVSAVLARRASASRAIVGADEEWKRRTLAPIGTGPGSDASSAQLDETDVARILALTEIERIWLESLSTT